MEPIVTEDYTITEESMARESERLFEKARHDESQALYHAKMESELKGIQKGKTEVARKLKRLGIPFDQIAAATDLSHDEIEKL